MGERAVPSVAERTIQSLIGQIYDAAIDAAKWPVFLESLAEAYHGPAWIFSQDLVDSRACLALHVGMDPAYLKSYEDYFASRNIWIQNATRNRNATHHFEEGHFAAGQDDIDTPTLERTEFYNDWLKPQGFFESAGCCLVKRGSLTTNITVIRARRPGTFEAQERLSFNRLIPHLQRAIRIHGELISVQVQRDRAFQALEGLDAGVVVAAPDGKILFANGPAERLLCAGYGVSAQGGRLCGSTNGATDLLREAIRAASATTGANGEDRGRSLRLPYGMGRFLSVLVSPITPDAAFLGVSSGPSAMLIFSDPRRRRGASLAEMAEFYGISQAEARLLKALVEGERLAAYAARAGVSLNTVKTQLAQLFAKTGENRQSDLIRRVLSDLPP